jgi:NOL1/NOP2/sun family putative RNA methylase
LTLRQAQGELYFDRYRGLIDDWPAFIESIASPIAPVIWAHPERIDRAELIALLAASGIGAVPIAYDPLALTLDGKPGKHWTHWAGLYYVQSAASYLPVIALDPKPGERVLDLCAAPGGKTARIAIALENRGTVVANDRSVPRLTALTAAIARLGLCNVTVTSGDGAMYRYAGTFDKVLVDAPCTGEGRRTGARHSPDQRSSLCGLQRALLRRAIALVRPGGRVVYSTCTFAPEENEAIVDDVVRDHDVELESFAAPHELAPSPGITEWEGRRYDARLARTVRLWPHRSRTTGFFVASLIKHGDASSIDDGVHEGDPQSALLRGFIDHFGLDAGTFDPYTITTAGRYARIIAGDHSVPRGPRIVTSGLPIARNRPGASKLSTAGALAFGRGATRHVIDVDPDVFIARETIHVDAPRGYTIARASGHPLGLGLVRERDGGAVLESEYPKGWSQTATGRWNE